MSATHAAGRPPVPGEGQGLVQGLVLFGGSFDPPHSSHRRLAESAVLRLRPARLLVVPCAQNPLKPGACVAPAEDRVAMCRLAFGGLAQAEVSRIEVDRAGPSFTIDTVRALRGQLGLEAPLWLLCGSDVLAELDRWRDRHTLLELATLVVFPRVGWPIDARAIDKLAIRRKHKDEILAHVLDVLPDSVNATAIRDALARGEEPQELAPDVLAYVRAHGLYLARSGVS
ncbi:MAG: nicotinate (nicotinamide) nucleotide adenylyltransferase [Planctomycetes bacterium]|nr:nicotinate (nicotinamide) nucleotide adenylyltransferase [Planctomycetota bacterium]